MAEEEAAVARSWGRRRGARGFIAKYPGKCASCDKRFRRGSFVQYNNTDDIVHAPDCENAVDEAPNLDAEEAEYDKSEYADYEEIGSKPESVCPSCFLVHVGECL